jgi:Spy/CpxP family protein refolding chaperone
MVIFGTGVVTGGLLVRNADRGRSSRPQPNQQVLRQFQPTTTGMRMDFLRRVQRDLDLTAEQRERIDRILKESQERSRKIMEPVSPLLRQELQQIKAAFREELTPEQRARFDALLKQQSQRPRDPKQSGQPRDRLPEGRRGPETTPHQ